MRYTVITLIVNGGDQLKKEGAWCYYANTKGLYLYY